ncbi:MAG: hypothetical protein ACRDOB_25385 [Streptosporangiaceae bacterium]
MPGNAITTDRSAGLIMAAVDSSYGRQGEPGAEAARRSNILIVNPDSPGTPIAADEWSELEASRPR